MCAVANQPDAVLAERVAIVSNISVSCGIVFDDYFD